MLAIESLKQEHEEFAEKVSEKLSSFRCDCYNEVIRKYIINIKEKKDSNNLKIKINATNALYFTADSEKVSVIYGMHFEDKTDINLAKLFFRELEDAKFGVSGAIDVKYHLLNIPETVLKVEEKTKDFNCGFVMFSK